MRYSQQLIDENKAAEDEVKKNLQNYLQHIDEVKSRLPIDNIDKPEEPILSLPEAQSQYQQSLQNILQHNREFAATLPKYENAESEPILPLSEAESNLDKVLLNQANDYLNKYPKAKFTKTKNLLNEI